MGSCFGQESRVILKETVKVDAFTVSKDVQVGTGGYAQIWKSKDVKTHKMYALKQMRLQNSELVEIFDRQCRIMGKLSGSRHTVRMIAQEKKKQKDSYFGYILMDFAEMSLFDIVKNRKLDNREIKSILLQIAEGLKQMHKSNVFHLDLKPQNILCIRESQSPQPCYKIGDFGSAIQKLISLPQLSKAEKSKLSQYIESNSTLLYRSPQMVDLYLNINKRIDSSSDVWMFGCIAYVLVFRKHPFEDGQKLAIMSCNVKYEEKEQNMDIIDVIKGCLIRESESRFKIQEIIQKLSQRKV